MHHFLCLLFFLTLGQLYGQQTSPMEILFQEQPPLRIQVRDVPQAKKAFNHYRLKIISGTVVGSAGVILPIILWAEFHHKYRTNGRLLE